MIELARLRSAAALSLCVTAFAPIVLTAPARAQAQASAYQVQPELFRATDFKLQSGETLKELVVEYATLGTPKRDAGGNIINAVINPHGWSGNYAQTATIAKDMIGPGRPLDPEKYFIIFPTAIGSPGSSSPSSSGLGPKFPSYTVGDMVASQYRLVTEKFNIKKLAGVIGASMGGYQTLQWATQYPDMMTWAVPIVTSKKADGRNLGIFGVMSYNIRTDPAYQDGNYKDQPRDGMRRGFMSTYLWYFGAAYYDAQYKTEAQILKGLENAGIGSDKMDANDIVWRNNAIALYDVSVDLPKVKAKTLVVGVVEDELFPPKEAIEPIAASIPGAKTFFYESPLGHLGGSLHIGKATDAIMHHISAAESN